MKLLMKKEIDLLPSKSHISKLSSASFMENEEFAVEKIVGHRVCMGKSQYLVRWEGFPSDDDTWEPIENLRHCLNLVRQFEISKSAAKTKSKMNSIQTTINYHKSLSDPLQPNNLVKSIYQTDFKPDNKSLDKAKDKRKSTTTKPRRSTKKTKGHSNPSQKLLKAVLIPKIKIKIPNEKAASQDSQMNPP